MKKVYLKGVNVVIEGVSREPIYIPIRTARMQPRNNQIVVSDHEADANYRIDLDELEDGDGNTFPDISSAVEYLSEFVGSFKKEVSGGGTTSGIMFDFTAQNYTELNQTAGQTVGQIAFVYNPQGNKWLPGTLGGTYFPKGTYVWTGSSWVSNRNDIAKELHDLQPESIDFVVPSNSDLQTNVGFLEYISGFLEVSVAGSQITPAGVVDNTNVSTNEANLINGNLTDLTYNNSNQGTVNKELPGIDMGATTNIAEIVLHWWNNTYTASNYKIQGSNDGTNWTDIVLNQNSTGIVGTANNPQRFQVNVNFRYIRPFCVQGNNTSWCVVSELQAFETGETIIKEVCTEEDIEILDEGGLLKIRNNGSNQANLKIVKR